MIINDQTLCRMVAALERLVCKEVPKISEGLASCLEVTVAGAWGNIGDRIQEIKWYDVSGDNPELYNTTWFNRNTQAFVTGITSTNVIPCIDDLPAVVSVSNFPTSFEMIPPTSDTTVITQVGASTSSVVLKVANADRRGLTIQNDSVSILLVALASVTTDALYTVKMQPNAYYEVPFNYIGIVSGKWVSATGDARVTEFT